MERERDPASIFSCYRMLACIRPQAAVLPILFQLPRFWKAETIDAVDTMRSVEAARSKLARTFVFYLTTIFSTTVRNDVKGAGRADNRELSPRSIPAQRHNFRVLRIGALNVRFLEARQSLLLARFG